MVLNFQIETGLIEGKVNMTQLTERVKRRSHIELLQLQLAKESKSNHVFLSLLSVSSSLLIYHIPGGRRKIALQNFLPIWFGLIQVDALM